jgi:AsmA protein
LRQSTARGLGGALGDSSRTDFTALSGTFTFRNGVAQTDDLQITAPTFNIIGVGWVNLAIQQVDFYIASKAQLGVAR